jgi:hypothetical protein
VIFARVKRPTRAMVRTWKKELAVSAVLVEFIVSTPLGFNDEE